MARGDPQFMRVQINFVLSDPRYLSLYVGYRAVYLSLWALAVKERKEVLPVSYTRPILSRMCHVDGKLMSRALHKIAENGLIELIDDGRIRVIGVRAWHPKLMDFEGVDNSPYGADTGPKGEKREERREEESVDGHASTVSPSSFLEFWNSQIVPLGFRPVNAISETSSRWRAIKARIKEGLWQKRGELVKAIKVSPWLQAQAWFGFGWIIRNGDHWRRVIDGEYKSKPEPKAKAPPGRALYACEKCPATFFASGNGKVKCKCGGIARRVDNTNSGRQSVKGKTNEG